MVIFKIKSFYCTANSYKLESNQVCTQGIFVILKYGCFILLKVEKCILIKTSVVTWMAYCRISIKQDCLYCKK